MVPVDFDLFAIPLRFIDDPYAWTAAYIGLFLIKHHKQKELEKRIEAIEHRLPSSKLMFPITTKKIGGYRFKEPTWYSPAHLGVDYAANFLPLYAPWDGVIWKIQLGGFDVGNMIIFKPNGKDFYVRMMHLSKVLGWEGKSVSRGEQIGVTGNTGWSTGPHLHLDVTKTISGQFWKDINNFIDPETLDWSDKVKVPVEEVPAFSEGYPKTVRVAKECFVRNTPYLVAGSIVDPDTHQVSSSFPTLTPGTEIKVVALAEGQSVAGNNQWYKSAFGNYIWSGNLEVI